MLRIPIRRYRPIPPEAPAGHESGMLELDRARTAFMLVDVYLPPIETGLETLSRADYDDKQRIFRELVPPALAAARRIGLPIIYVANSAPRIALERSAFGRQLTAVGTNHAREFAEESVDAMEYQRGPVYSLSYPQEIAPKPSDYYIRKHAYSGFCATRLEMLLHNLDVQTLVTVGIRLDGCLGTTLMDAHQLGFQVLLLRDCTIACDTPDEQPTRAFTQRMLLWYETMIGPTSTSAEFVEACASQGGAA